MWTNWGVELLATVLIIEDEPSHERLFVEFLKATGWQTVAVRDAKQALEVAPSLQPSAIVLDILLPDIDGMRLISLLRRKPELAKTPILVVSAISDFDAERKCLGAGADAYMQKPISLRDFGRQLAFMVAVKPAVPPRKPEIRGN